MLKALSLAGSILATMVATSAVAQEKCYSDGKKTLIDWENANNGELKYWADQMEKTRASSRRGRIPVTALTGSPSLAIAFQGI